MEQYKVITLTHKQLSISRIGRFIISAENTEAVGEKLKAIKSICSFKELFYLATCNRVMFLFVSDRKIDSDFVEKFLYLLNSRIPFHEIKETSGQAAILEGRDAVSHLFEVASSLESLVIGEREILRQLKDAYDFSRKFDLTGDKIRLLFERAIQVAKKVYSQTRIGEKPISVVSLAGTELLKRKLDKNARFLIVGAGQTNHLMAKFLLKHGFKNFTVYNRSLENAQRLAEKLKGSAYPLSELASHTGGFEVIITCTGATQPIITEKIYKAIAQGEEPKLVIDLAVPRDVDEKVPEQFPMEYIEMEKLRALAQENMGFRRQEVVKAKDIVEKSIKDFALLLDQRRLELLLKDIPLQIKELKERALTQVFSKEIEQLDPGSRETLHKVLSYMEKKYISMPITTAKKTFLKD